MQCVEPGEEDVPDVVASCHGCTDKIFVFFCVIEVEILDQFLAEPLLVCVCHVRGLCFPTVLV
jgi:hypothetical protein